METPKIKGGNCEFCGIPAKDCEHFKGQNLDDNGNPIVAETIEEEAPTNDVEVLEELPETPNEGNSLEKVDEKFDQAIKELSAMSGNSNIKSGIVSYQSLTQMIKAHELKYIENVLEVSEENKLVETNLNDFFAYPEEVQKKALEIRPQANRDPEYFSRPGADTSLIKPLLILDAIDRKKNEAKVKTWKVEYHERLIEKLKAIRCEYQSPTHSFFSKLLNALIK